MRREELVELCQGLQHNRSIRHLSLNVNNFGAAGTQSLAPFVENNDRLQKLDLVRNNYNLSGECDHSFEDEGANVLCGMLRNRDNRGCPPLQSIKLQDNGISNAGIATLTATLIDIKPGLKDIYLSQNDFGTNGCAAIAAFLNNPKCSVKEIYLNDNDEIGDEALVALFEPLNLNTTLTGLDVTREQEMMDDKDKFSPSALAALLKLVCDTSSINATYCSNHTISSFGVDFPLHLSECQNQILYRATEQYLEMNARGSDKTLIAREKILLNYFTGDFDFAPIDKLTQTTVNILPKVIGWLTKDAHPTYQAKDIRLKKSKRPLCGFAMGYGQCPFSDSCPLKHKKSNKFSREHEMNDLACPFFVKNSCSIRERCPFKHVRIEGQKKIYDMTKLSAVYRVLLRNVPNAFKSFEVESCEKATKKRRLECIL